MCPNMYETQTFKMVFLFLKTAEAESGTSDFFNIKRYFTSLKTATSYWKKINDHFMSFYVNTSGNQNA